MQNHRIINKNDKWYFPFCEIYEYSFPLHKQRTAQQQDEAFNHPAYHLDVFIENDTLLGFLSYWEFDAYIYIEHFAVNRSFRGKNIGSNLLASFTEEQHKTVLLEIDPLVDEISRKRLEFYKRNGFTDNPFEHNHPPYRAEFPPHHLIVLSHGGSISQELCQQFRQDLEDIVMKKS